jgi:hypothetical protein
MSANELTDVQPWITNNLSKYFIIEPEYKIVCNGKSRYADFILTCKQSNQKYGIECKSANLDKGTDVYKWIKQARTYSYYSGIPFFVFPHISGRIFDDLTHKRQPLSHDNNVSTFLGAYGVGELFVDYRIKKVWDIYKYVEVKYLWIEFVYHGKVLWKNNINSDIDPKTANYKYILNQLNIKP